MPKRSDVKKVLVIGSGPIIIGQAAEFDYAGTQACRALKEEGLEVVLVNSNPATIMTDKTMADKIYIEPLNVEIVKQIIDLEKPDSVLPTLGGQAGLNLFSLNYSRAHGTLAIGYHKGHYMSRATHEFIRIALEHIPSAAGLPSNADAI